MSHTIPHPTPVSPPAWATRRWAWLSALVLPLALGPGWVAALGDAPGLGRLGTWSGLVLVLLITVCSMTDLGSRRIPNWATYTAFLWAFLLNAIDSPGPAAGAGRLGGVGLGAGAAGAAVCFTVMLFIYRVAGGGAGDVKLATALGALLGLDGGLHALVYTYLAAGVAVVCWVVWTVGPVVLAASLARRVGSALWPGRVAPPTDEQRQLLGRRIPLAPFFAVGAIPVLFEVEPPW